MGTEPELVLQYDEQYCGREFQAGLATAVAIAEDSNGNKNSEEMYIVCAWTSYLC